MINSNFEIILLLGNLLAFTYKEKIDILASNYQKYSNLISSSYQS